MKGRKKASQIKKWIDEVRREGYDFDCSHNFGVLNEWISDREEKELLKMPLNEAKELIKKYSPHYRGC